jgi:hypothetical protein
MSNYRKQKVQLRYNYILSVTKMHKVTLRTSGGAANQTRIFTGCKTSRTTNRTVILPCSWIITSINEQINPSKLSEEQRTTIVVVAALAACGSFGLRLVLLAAAQ